MNKKHNFFIESLDDGYVLTDNGKTKAFNNSSSLLDYLGQRFLKSIERIYHLGIRNMTISINVDESVQTLKND